MPSAGVRIQLVSVLHVSVCAHTFEQVSSEAKEGVGGYELPHVGTGKWTHPLGERQLS